MTERKIVGWFYRNGKRIPIFEKSDSPKRSNIYQGKNVDELEANVEEGRGVKLDSADRNAIRYHGRDTNGERVSLYGETKTGMRKAETAMYNNYWDGDKELINFRRKADPDVLRHNVKAAGKSERASKVKDASFTTRVERDVMENPGDYGILHHEPKKSSNIKRGEGKNRAVDVTPRYPSGAAMSRTGGSENTRAYNSKVLDGVKAKIEKYGTAEVSNDRIAGTSKAFMDLAKEAGYTVRSDNKSDSIILSGKKNPTGKASIKKPAESYIKAVMEDRGLTRAEALKYIKEQRKKK